MKLDKSALSLSILLFAALACNFTSPQAETPIVPAQPQNNTILQSEDDVPRIGVAEAKAAFDSGQAILVDVRSTESYMNRHAAGAVSIPLDRFEKNINTIPLDQDQWIITYCT